MGVLVLVGCGSSASTPPQPGELIGSIQISAGVPDSSCLVLLEGTPLSSRCDETGEFDIKQVPPGRWDLRIIPDGSSTALAASRIAAGSNPGLVSDLGIVALEQPGSIGGHILSAGGVDLSLAIIAVPDLGAVTTPNQNGGYLLAGVAPGTHDVVLIEDAGSVSRPDVGVQPAKVTIGADIDLSSLSPPGMTAISGFAARADAGDGGHGGISIELVEDLDGTTVASVKSASDGAFTIGAPQGSYIIRARDGKNPITAIVPSLVVHGTGSLALASKLTIPPESGDLDGDGIPNSSDPDIDGDGVPNDSDAFPYDPAESLDSDGDGIGDRSDLRSKGGPGIDTQNPTPDTDGDGKLDFEDNCPTVANADQKDSDGDGIGDACDDCPFVANPDQKDSAGNGTGDACRACATNADCPGGKLCSFGQCVGCISNAQCGDEVCDAKSGTCGPCATSSQCTAPDQCSSAHRCVQCLSSSDCPAGDACVAGACQPACTNDAGCPGEFCVAGACAQCRSTADCPSTEWCDSGQCKPQCTTDGDCTGGRTCDPTTRTCVLPCAGTCATGQTCVVNVCRDACDASHPCGAGLKCSAGACVPQCAVDADCASVAPFTVCQAGACVPNGACAFDADCPTTQLCLTGTCSPRTGTFVAGKGYTCTSACNCRQGETCSVNAGDSMKYCVTDVAPTRFVAAGACASGTCDGKTPSGWATDLGATVAAAAPGEVIAVHAGDTFGAAVLGQSGLTLAGGFSMCAPNRWVRDPSLRSTTGQLSVPGTSPAPLPNVTIENVNPATAVSVNSVNVIDATYADGLTVANVTVSNAPTAGATVAFTGLSCGNCNNVAWSNVFMPGVDGSAGGYTVTVARLAHGSGTISGVGAGNIYALSASGIVVSDTTGPLSITKSQLASVAQGQGGNGIYVTDGSGGLVTIDSNDIGFGLATNGGISSDNWYGIWVQATPNAAVTNNIIDGRGLADAGNGLWVERDGIRIDGSSGTVSGNAVYYPTTATVQTLYGYRILGPAATVSFTMNTASLGTLAHGVVGLDVENITSGAVTIGKSSLSVGTAVGATAFNWSGNTITFAMTDTTLDTGTGSGTAYGANISNGVGRLERCKLTTAGNRAATFALYNGSSQIELYDSWLYSGGVAGGAGSSQTVGLYIDSGSSFYGVHNTIDGGGSSGNSAPSTGVYCTSSTAIMTNNLINGGSSPQARRLLAGAAASCFEDANWVDNYLWYSSSTAPDSNDQATTINNGNFVVGNVTCYDTVDYTQPDYHIGAGSPCVDRGASPPKRKDGSTITVDIDGNARTQGGGPDIGCHEVK